MTEQALDTFLKQEIAAFPCKTAVLVGEVESGKVLWALEPDTQVVSASTIRVPVHSPGLEKGFKPLMQAASVLLPLPEGPAISTRSPG